MLSELFVGEFWTVGVLRDWERWRVTGNKHELRDGQRKRLRPAERERETAKGSHMRVRRGCIHFSATQIYHNLNYI